MKNIGAGIATIGIWGGCVGAMAFGASETVFLFVALATGYIWLFATPFN